MMIIRDDKTADLQMALDLVVGEAVDLHELPDLLRRRHCTH